MSARVILLAIAGAAVAALILLEIFVHRLRRHTGFGSIRGRGLALVASDTGAMNPVLLRDPILGVCGKPDYLLEESPPAGVSSFRSR
ncbi:MAG TPA: hypothetical protein VN650_09010 [Gemmatimonadaceae bacterium]|nr:hypothetical protein [Gemmatimonadaceae bacterium]